MPPKLTKNLFSSALPSIFVEKIKILPTNVAGQEQKVEVSLSLQKLRDAHLGPYRIFVGFVFEESVVHKLVRHPSYGRRSIKTPVRNAAEVQKRYIKMNPKDNDFNESGQVSADTQIVKKTLTFTESFNLDGLQNLYMYAVVYAIDPQSLATSGVETNLAAMILSQPAITSILSNRRSSTMAHVYVLRETIAGYGETRDIWSGPIHYTSNGVLMAGAKHISGPHPKLKAVPVSNQKVQDLRFLNSANSLPFNLQENPSLTSRRASKEREIRERITATRPQPLSDVTFSRTLNSGLKMMFSLNRSRLVSQNTKLGFFIVNKTSLNSCLQIKDIRIYRARINPNIQPNKLTPGKMNIAGSDTMISTEKLVASLKNGSVKAVQLGVPTPDVLNFMASDISIQDEDLGTYQYTAFIDVVDSSVDAIRTLSEELITSLSLYNKYVDNIEIQSRTSSRKSRLQTSDIKIYMKQNRGTLKSTAGTWKTLINTYMKAVKFIFGTEAFTAYSELEWKKNLIAMVNPANADINTIRKMAEVIGDFNTNLQRMYKGATAYGSESTFKITSQAGSQHNDKKITNLEHVFTSKYRMDNSAQEGTDYLDIDLATSNPKNFTNISFASFAKRLETEMSKYPTVDTSTVTTNLYGFLSPRRLIFKENIVDTGTERIPQDAGNAILASVLDPGSKTNQAAPSNSAEDVNDSQMDALLSYAGVTAIPLKVPLHYLMQSSDIQRTLDATFASVSYLSDDAQFNNELEDTATSVSGSSESIIEHQQHRRSQILKSEMVAFVTEQLSVGFQRDSDVRDLAPMINSLAGQTLSVHPDTVVTNNNIETAINYNSIGVIQYFSGYRYTAAGAQINDEMWQTLNQQEFHKLKNAGAPILCRIFLVNNAIGVPNKYVLPPYNSLFILGDASAVATPVNPSTYRGILDSLDASTRAANFQAPLNINTEAANIDLTYVCSSPMKAPASAGAPAGGQY